MSLTIDKMRRMVRELKNLPEPRVAGGHRENGSTFIYVPKSMVSEARALGWDVEPWPEIPA